MVLTFYLVDPFHFVCSHVFGTVSDQSDLDNSQIGADDNDIEDEYETVRRQRAEKRARIASQRSQPRSL